MALADSRTAIGGVTLLLQDHLIRRGFAVTVGKPETASQDDTSAKLNLYLYETEFDGSLRNVSLDPERPPPLWLCLKYLITAFDDGESSDTADAHALLGQGVCALHALNFLTLDNAVDPAVRLALENNPEALKISFESAPADLLSRVMQGSEERYRLSIAFQVRPVMMVPDEPPRFAQLVGVDYTTSPQTIVGRDGVGIEVLASLGPRLTRVVPHRFEPGQRIEIFGDDLHLAGLRCFLAGEEIRVVGQMPDRIVVEVEGTPTIPGDPGPIAAGGTVSAGERPLILRQPLANGRFRESNALIGSLRPVVASATLGGGGMLTVSGALLGTDSDDVLVALLRDGAVVRLFDSPVTAADQGSLTLPGVGTGVDPGTYLIVVRVNGQQARTSPALVVV